MSLNNPDNTSEKRKELDDYNIGIVIGLVMAKWTTNRISKEINIPESTVKTIKYRYQSTGTGLTGKRPGRPKKLNDREERAIVRNVRREPMESFGRHLARLENRDINICKATLIKYLDDLGFNSYVAAHKPLLEPHHVKKRLAWTKAKVNWTDDQWSHVVWSDESRFNVIGNDGGARVIRMEGERYKDEHVLKTKKFGSGSVMVWGCFWSGGVGPLVVLDGSVNQLAYIECLKDNLVPWLEELSETEGKPFIYQEDGASSHTGKLSREWKDNQRVVHGFDFWPAQSPDLNPIEHLWAILEKRIESRRHHIQNKEQLAACLKDEWTKIDSALCMKLVESMTSRCKAVIAAKGHSTKY